MTSDDDETIGRVARPTRAAAKAARRRNLIEATISSIAHFGLSGTTLARVAKIAGTSVGLANFHFDTKDHMLAATLQFLADEQRGAWQTRNLDASLTPVERLVAIVDSRFHARICDPRKLAIWFAFWGDASAREIYRQVVSGLDDERLDATVAILTAMGTEAGHSPDEIEETALGLEAFCDGLWLNMLLYPDDFKRLACRRKALGYLAALFPAQFAAWREHDACSTPTKEVPR